MIDNLAINSLILLHHIIALDLSESSSNLACKKYSCSVDDRYSNPAVLLSSYDDDYHSYFTIYLCCGGDKQHSYYAASSMMG